MSSTRGRRSAGESAASLNLAMIHLLDMSRLREELKNRGLDTRGNKSLLADRLEEAVRMQKFSSILPMDNSPIINKKSKLVESNDEYLKLNSVEKLTEKSSQLHTTPSKKTKRLLSPLKKTIKKKEKKKKSNKQQAKLIPDILFFEMSNNKNNVEDVVSSFVWASEAPIKALQKISHSITTEEVEETEEVLCCVFFFDIILI